MEVGLWGKMVKKVKVYHMMIFMIHIIVWFPGGAKKAPQLNQADDALLFLPSV